MTGPCARVLMGPNKATLPRSPLSLLRAGGTDWPSRGSPFTIIGRTSKFVCLQIRVLNTRMSFFAHELESYPSLEQRIGVLLGARRSTVPGTALYYRGNATRQAPFVETWWR